MVKRKVTEMYYKYQGEGEGRTVALYCPTCEVGLGAFTEARSDDVAAHHVWTDHKGTKVALYEGEWE